MAKATSLPSMEVSSLETAMISGSVPHRLWTDEDNYNLIKDHYAWFLDTYESLSKPVMKADSARYLYMYHIGGEGFSMLECVLQCTSNSGAHSERRPHQISCSLLASLCSPPFHSMPGRCSLLPRTVGMREMGRGTEASMKVYS